MSAFSHCKLSLAMTAVFFLGSRCLARQPASEGISASSNAKASEEAVTLLKRYLAASRDARPTLGKQAFASVPLTRADADTAEALLWDDHANRIRETRGAEMEGRVLKLGELEMPFAYRIYGDAGKNGRSLYISLHGGGGAPKAVNDQQWENQKLLYQPQEGVYVAPRAPTNTWNLWHEEHIDRLFDRLIENFIVFENVDPNRVYLLGYSAGGDGVYQLAPRMADCLAAASMMAGHPNDASPLGLRNLPFTIHVGGQDSGYQRNAVAREWEGKLDKLREADAQGYEHWVRIYPDKGHWMDREDAAAIPWMAKFDRNPIPTRIVWKQAKVLHSRFYWLAVAEEDRKAGIEVVATRKGQEIELTTAEVKRLTIRLHDRLLDLDRPITVKFGVNVVFQGQVNRTIAMIERSLRERGDPQSIFHAELVVSVPTTK
jgi:predicted esterase